MYEYKRRPGRGFRTPIVLSLFREAAGFFRYPSYNGTYSYLRYTMAGANASVCIGSICIDKYSQEKAP